MAEKPSSTGHRLHERIGRRLRDEGLVTTTLRALRAGGRRILRYEVDVYTGIDLQKPSPPPAARLPVEFRWATDDEYGNMLELALLNEQDIERRSSRPDDRHWAGFVRDRTVFMCCVPNTWPLPPALNSRVGDSPTTYIRGVFALPELTGEHHAPTGRLFAAGLCTLFQALREEGFRSAWGSARHHNIRSIRAQIAAGMNIIGAECYWQSLQWRFGTEWK